MNHASLIDGCRYSGATLKRFRHNDIEDLKKQMEENGNKTGRRMVVIDGVFSMSGNVCNAPEIIKICKEYDAALFIDECHSHFVLGKTGGGIKELFQLKEEDVDIEMGTLSKAIPAVGGYIAGSADMVTYLRRASRGFIYSGATSAVMIAAALASLKIFRRERESLITRLTENIRYFRQAIADRGLKLTGGGQTPIVPILVGSATVATHVAAFCQKRNVFIHAVAPPVVERGKAIMRASIMVNHRKEDLQYAAGVIAESVNKALEEIPKEEAALM
jgi:7-keto-8-aminopelargonate synthetase-like enzyme